MVFIKASWHVGEPFTTKYSEWLLAHADGRPTTHGTFDEALYRYAVTYVRLWVCRGAITCACPQDGRASRPRG